MSTSELTGLVIKDREIALAQYKTNEEGRTLDVTLTYNDGAYGARRGYYLRVTPTKRTGSMISFTIGDRKYDFVSKRIEETPRYNAKRLTQLGAIALESLLFVEAMDELAARGIVVVPSEGDRIRTHITLSDTSGDAAFTVFPGDWGTVLEIDYDGNADASTVYVNFGEGEECCLVETTVDSLWPYVSNMAYEAGTTA